MSFFQRVQTYMMMDRGNGFPSLLVHSLPEALPATHPNLATPSPEPIEEQHEIIVHDFGGHFGLAWVAHEPSENLP